MNIKRLTPALLLCATFFASNALHAETIKQGLMGCVSESLLDELLTYINKGDKAGMMQLLVSGQCMLLKVGDPVSVISPGFMTATIRYKGVKLYTPSESIR
ncbi:MAG: hypothetical protein V9G23_06075 [Giesbergeria sp.]